MFKAHYVVEISLPGTKQDEVLERTYETSAEAIEEAERLFTYDCVAGYAVWEVIPRIVGHRSTLVKAG